MKASNLVAEVWGRLDLHIPQIPRPRGLSLLGLPESSLVNPITRFVCISLYSDLSCVCRLFLGMFVENNQWKLLNITAPWGGHPSWCKQAYKQKLTRKMWEMRCLQAALKSCSIRAWEPRSPCACASLCVNVQERPENALICHLWSTSKSYPSGKWKLRHSCEVLVAVSKMCLTRKALSQVSEVHSCKAFKKNLCPIISWTKPAEQRCHWPYVTRNHFTKFVQ